MQLTKSIITIILVLVANSVKAAQTPTPTHTSSQLTPQRVQANTYANAGRQFEEHGNTAAADKQYALAIKTERNNPLARYSRGYLRLVQGQNEAVVEDMDIVIEQCPLTTAFYCRGLAHFRMGQIDKSIDDFSDAIALSPQDYSNYFLRAKGRFILKDYSGATSDCLKAIWYNPAETAEKLRLEINLACSDLHL
ncbi:MAG: tetratricopeptide repeat protein [Candidatus Obscuribacter sp.]|nr:tetratricopeptide repeat protein [Candidatus Obscuribacter sp.]